MSDEPERERDHKHDHGAFHKELFFFYGTLMDPSTLSSVLGFHHRPMLYPAYILGYQRMLWGRYPALLPHIPERVVRGVAYLVQSEAERERLVRYETNRYVARECRIWLEDGRERRGGCFCGMEVERSLLRGSSS